MELSIGTILSIISVIICISTFVLNRKDKAVKDTKENHQELIEYQLKELKDDVKEILSKLDKYEKDVKNQINEAMDLHIKMYHSDGGKK